MKESSLAEKIMASMSVLILASVISFGSYLVTSFHSMELSVADKVNDMELSVADKISNMELSVAAEVNQMRVEAATLAATQIERLGGHLTNHPDARLGRRIDRHEEQMHE